MYLYERIRQDKEEQKKQEELRKKFIDAPNRDLNNVPHYVSLMPSISHTYGNVLAFIQNYIIKKFPENMFLTIHVHSKIAHRQIRSFDNEFIKRHKPMIIFRPRISDKNEDRFLKGTLLTEKMYDKYLTWGDTNLQPFYEDPKINTSLKFLLNRSVMYVDVIIVLSTLMQQIDYVHYLENAIRWDHPYKVDTCLEGYLSQELLKIIADLSHVPLYDDNGCTKDFLDYMNGHSLYPITYKMQGSSGNKEFYRYYPTKVELTFTDLSKDEGEQSGSVMSQYQITFSVRLEFNSNGLYYLFNDDIHNLKLPKVEGANSDLIPVYTDVLLADDIELAQGWSLYTRASLRLEDPNDKVCIDSMFNNSIRSAMKYHMENGLPLMDLIDIKIRKQGVMIREGVEYDIDWNTKELIFHNQDTYHTYTILICINVEYTNELVKTVYNLK